MSLSTFREQYLHTPSAGVLIVQSSIIPDAGFGVFAGKDFIENEPITEYYGQILHYKTAKTRLVNTHLRTLFMMRFVIDGLYHPDGTVIQMDAIKDRNTINFGVGAFINDNIDDKKQINCRFEIYDSNVQSTDPFQFNPNERLVYIKAKRSIKCGEELFISYGNDYWTRVVPKKAK